MKDGKFPDPNEIHPIAGYSKEIYVRICYKTNQTVGRIM